MSNSSPPSHRRVSRTRRTFVTLLVLANVVVFGAYFYLHNLESTFENAVTVNEDVVRELSASPEQSSDPSTFLVIGSDSRENIPGDFEDHFGSAAGQRADVIMLVQVQPEDDTAQLLSIPRDLKVEIEGYGTQKINAAYAYGGGRLLVSTVRAVTGLPVHHYVEVDFGGFAAIVEEVGGVTINFAHPARDLKSGLDVPAGQQVLDGEMALAYARSRSYQELRDGTWRSANASDIGRMGRQQELVFAILSQIKRPSTITQAEEVVIAIGSHLEVDAALVDRGVLELAWAMRGIRPGGIEAFIYPTSTSNIGGISYEVPVEPAASDLLREFAAGGAVSAAVNPSDVRLEVLNGSGVAGIAGRWAEKLGADGFVIESIGDATSFDHPITQLIVSPGNASIGGLIVESLGFGEVVSGTLTPGVDVRIILGSDAS
ncbi:MAG: LCP family protein [Acidimicrobiia bacterium]|nr:LCP family protein [Acidimicrobiia bacterium]